MIESTSQVCSLSSTSFDVQEQIIRDQFFPARQSTAQVPQKLPKRERHSEDLLRLI